MKKTLLLISMAPFINAQAEDWQHKVSAEVLKQLNSNQDVEIILRLQSPATTSNINSNNRIEKIQNKVAQLKQTAKETQKPIIEYLTANNIPYRSYWISNDLLITAKSGEITALLARKEIKKAFSNAPIQLNLPAPNKQTIQTPTAIEWNVSMVNAPQVWSNYGVTGENIIIAGQDTGYQWNHPALLDRYRGWDGQSADHNYNWHDSIDSPQVSCGNAPCDDHGHGSHTMGTMIGDDGATNQIGVAPGAQWIGCRNMDVGNGTPTSYAECFQWFLEPTDLNGQNPDSNYAPHIINNSWGCPGFEGCTDPLVLRDTVNNVVAAGILVVSSAGNSGSACNTITTPAAIYDKSLTVGSTTSSDLISGFSSRGGVVVDGVELIKPNLSAPGSSVRSANNNSGYTTFSGTSMASPNVAAVAALVMSANPSLAGKPELVKKVLERTSVPKTSTQTCNGVPGSTIPNNTFGWGRIDALQAVDFASDLIYFDDFQQ
ncbi:S8 family serine peptidase [Marinicella litoralis]|uniref:Subtilase family protein n=1 Tax=Marinicella litoralis TaxID=644220 RepID=A0A4R6XNQ3_9GAMM|nr:S8 family serine peptidase [Marinicella litoralis]TDR19357.1 subtilase family protein [Marinicella litoralis]